MKREEAKTSPRAKNLMEEVEEYRKLFGVTQKEISDNTGIAWATVNTISNGLRNPALGIFLEYCNYVGLEVVIKPREASKVVSPKGDVIDLG